MVDDRSVQLAVEAARTQDDLESLLTALIRVALGRRSVLESAVARAEAVGDEEHLEAAARLKRALELRALWGDDGRS